MSGNAITDDDRPFQIPCVPPNTKVIVSRVLPIDGGEVYTHRVSLQTEAGKDHEVSIGGTGRPVIGRVNVPETEAKYSWAYNSITTDLSGYQLLERVKDLSPEQKQTWCLFQKVS